MPRFSANLGFLFPDRAPVDRVAAAATAGFKAVELHWPYDIPAQTMRAAIDTAGVAMLALNTPIGNAAAGEFGLGALPGRQAEFQDAVDQSLAYGKTIGATALHCMAGVTGGENDANQKTFVENLRVAADKAEAAGLSLLIEPINHRDRPGYFLSRIEHAAAIIEETGRANVQILFDCFHTQIMQGDLIRRMETHRPLIGHVQIAAVPDRAEPDHGEIDYREICRALDAIGYAGWIGAEYRPRGRTEEGLSWLAAWSDPR